MARGSLEMQDTKISKNSPSAHHRTTLSSYIFATKACIDNPKKLVKQIGCLPYFHTWCGLSANLECRSEKCCARLAGNTGRKKSQKKSPSGHHPITLSGYIFSTKARIDNQKKNLLSSNISSRCPPQYGELRPTNG